jgi:hypothetical protein
MYFTEKRIFWFDDLRQFPNFQLNKKIYHFLDIFITTKLYTLFFILIAVGFYLQFSKHREDSVDFLKAF